MVYSIFIGYIIVYSLGGAFNFRSLLVVFIFCACVCVFWVLCEICCCAVLVSFLFATFNFTRNIISVCFVAVARVYASISSNFPASFHECVHWMCLWCVSASNSCFLRSSSQPPILDHLSRSSQSPVQQMSTITSRFANAAVFYIENNET